MRIGELLINSGIITEEQLNEALKLQEKNKKKLGEILVELGYINSHDLIWLLSEQASIPFIELKPDILDSKLIHSFPEKLLYQYCIIPLYEIEGKIFVATGNPTDTSVVDEIKKIAKKDVVLCAAEPEKILQLLDRFFLVEQTESIFVEEEFKGNVTINITDKGAVIKFVDEKGNIKSYRVNGEMTIKFTGSEKKSDNV